MWEKKLGSCATFSSFSALLHCQSPSIRAKASNEAHSGAHGVTVDLQCRADDTNDTCYNKSGKTLENIRKHF